MPGRLGRLRLAAGGSPWMDERRVGDDGSPEAPHDSLSWSEPLARHQVPVPGHTVATTDGESRWAFRYSSEGKSRSLFFSRAVGTLRQLYPGREILRQGGVLASQVAEPARLLLGHGHGDWM